MGRIRKTGKCRICKRRGYTELHHIVSQGHAIRTDQLDLLTNPGNIVELCRHHHNQTTASMVRNRLMNGGWPTKKNHFRKWEKKSTRPGVYEILYKQNKLLKETQIFWDDDDIE